MVIITYLLPGSILYFGHGLWNSNEGRQRARAQLTDAQPLLSDTIDDIDIKYDMEVIPAHREDWEKDSIEDEKFGAV